MASRDALQATPEAKRALLSLSQLGRETPLTDVRELVRSVLKDENVAGMLPALIARARNHFHSLAAGEGLGEKLVTNKLISALALEAGEDAPRIISPFLPLLPTFGSFKALADLLAFVDGVAAEELNLPPDTPYHPSALPSGHALQVIAATVHACFAEQLRADEAFAKTGEPVSNASKFAPHEKRGYAFAKHHADAIAGLLFPATQDANTLRRKYRQLRSSLNVSNGHIAETFFSARDVSPLASDTSRMTAGFRSKCKKAILNQSLKKHGEERYSSDDRRALREAVLEEAKSAVENGDLRKVPLPSDLYVLGREAERIATALAEGVDVSDDALLLNAGYAKLLESIAETSRSGHNSIAKLVSSIDDGSALLEEAGVTIEPSGAAPAIQVCIEATVEDVFLPAVLLAVALRDVEDRRRTLSAAEAAAGRDAVAAEREADALDAESAVAQAAAAGTAMETAASGGVPGQDASEGGGASSPVENQTPLPVYKSTVLVANDSSSTAIPIPTRAVAEAACPESPIAHTVAALAEKIRGLAAAGQRCDFPSLGQAIRDADPEGHAHVLISSFSAKEGDERSLGLPEASSVSVWRPCRAKLASEAFNPCAGRNVIQGAPVDAKGNPVGSEYDLGRDGAYGGCQVVVLQLYTSGFTFAEPKAALEAKGFVVTHHRNNPPAPEQLREELAGATQLWLISNWSSMLDLRHRRIIMEFWESGGGLYIFGDNDPFFVDANSLLSDIDDRLRGEQDASLPHLAMSGNWIGSQDVGQMPKPQTAGFAPGHELTTGLATSLAEGVTVAGIPADTAAALGFEEILREHEGHLVAAFLPAGSGGSPRRGPVMVDGAFTKLYCHWQTTGSARFVKNCACLLSTFTRAAREAEVKEELEGEARTRAKGAGTDEKAAFAVEYFGGTSTSVITSLIKARIGDLAERVALLLGVKDDETEETGESGADKEGGAKTEVGEQLSSLDASIVALRKDLESSNYDIVARAVKYMCDEGGQIDLTAGVHEAYLQRSSLQQHTAETLMEQGVTAGGLSEAGYPATISAMLKEAALANLRNRGRADNPRHAASQKAEEKMNLPAIFNANSYRG